MQIRSFQTEDSEPLASLFFRTIRRINIRDYTQEQVEAWAPADRDMEMWRRSFEGKTVYVAAEGEKVIGFGELESNGHIDRFYIDADWIGAGVGRKLYEAIENQARVLKLARLFVEASITAKPFFSRMGFVVVKEQTVVRRETALTNFVMEKFLST